MKSQTKILLVEDDPNDEELIFIAFKQLDLLDRVDIAHDGEEAIQYLQNIVNGTNKTNKQLPQMVLMDLKLPKIGGLEVLSHIRSDPRLSALIVVILSSSSEDKDIQACYTLGANSYVRKSVDFGHFVESIKQICRYWLSTNELNPS